MSFRDDEIDLFYKGVEGLNPRAGWRPRPTLEALRWSVGVRGGLDNSAAPPSDSVASGLRGPQVWGHVDPQGSMDHCFLSHLMKDRKDGWERSTSFRRFVPQAKQSLPRPVTVKGATLGYPKKCKVKAQCDWGHKQGSFFKIPPIAMHRLFVQRRSSWHCW